MRVPHTVPRNTLRAYSVPEQAETVSARRVQAENFTWDERMPPSLSSLCVRALVSSFTENSEALSSLGRQDLDFLLEVLPTDLDIDVVAPIVEDGIYWQRCCEYRWPERPLDVSKHGGSWRRMLLEKYLQHYIEDLQPEQVDLEDFEKKINVCSPFIIRLELRELKPPKNVYESRESSLTTSSCSHLDLSYVLSRLNNIEELILQFGVRNCGMDFNPKLFSISSRDIENLVKGIQQNHSLILLKIHRSSINDAKLNIIVSGVVEMKNLTILDFSHCQIGDKGAGYLATFIKAQGTLKKLNLSNNRIGAEGVEKFADLLGSEEEVCPVECLVLDFNLIGDEGSISLAAALLKNETLLDLKLQGTGMQNKGVLALADALLTNCTLLHLDASNNHLTVKCSAALMATLNSNKTLLTFDIRNCGIDKITELSVHKYVQRNRMASRYANQ